MNKRQIFAFHHPHDKNRRSIQKGCHRDIGKFSTLLTLDLYSDYPEMNDGLPEWHASAGMVTKRVFGELGPIKEIYDRSGLPMVNLLLWSERAWDEGIKLCRAMLRGVGRGNGYWTGEGASIHFRRVVSKDELLQISKLAI